MKLDQISKKVIKIKQNCYKTLKKNDMKKVHKIEVNQELRKRAMAEAKVKIMIDL